jgi:hypothetical protein
MLNEAASMRSLTLNLSQADSSIAPTRLTPQWSVFKTPSAAASIITDRPRFRPVLTRVDAVALRRLSAKDWKVDDYIRLLANGDTITRSNASM